MNSIVIGFTGGTGSGKTTLAQRLNEVFKNNSVIIKQDSYYKDFPDKSFEERVQINYQYRLDRTDQKMTQCHIKYQQVDQCKDDSV